VLSSLPYPLVYKAVKMQREEKGRWKEKVKIEKVWDRWVRSSACCESLEYYFYFSLS
jgi:hypothetical protein